MKKRILSMLLAIGMLISLLPTMAFAEGETHHACDASCGHVDGDPHSDSALTWNPWTDTTTLPYSGNYYLTADVTLRAQQTVSQTLNLCLNGHTIKPSGSGFSAIKITGNLSLTDCQGTGKITGFTNDSGQGGAVYSKGTFTMYGGTISGNTAAKEEYPYLRMGGGVYSEGTFTMYGGTISGNTSPSYGGGVYSKGTFTMYGGTISGNTVGAKYNTDGMGGGVYSEGTFTMHSGTISDNVASLFGGGVYIAPGKQFTMYDGIISGNTVTTTGNMYNYGGGGVYVAGSEFTMSGGIISGNGAGRYGGGVCIGNNTDNKTSGTFTMSSGTISGNKAPDGGGVYIDSGKQFTMNNGTISGNTSTAFGGGVCAYGTFTMNNGTISGNNASYGGGVNIGSSDSFTMTGGTITRNAATNYGGGVFMIRGAKAFELSGSPTISGNTGSNCYIDNNDTFMTVTGALEETANIGITTWSSWSSDPFCKPASSIDFSNYKNWFFSDSVDRAIAKNDDGSLYTKVATTYSVFFASENDYEKAKLTVRGIETDRAAEGDIVVISPKGDAVIESVTASGCTVTKNEDGTYSFTMPTRTVTITVTFPAPTYSITYGDDGGAAVNGSYTTNVTNSILAGTSVTINPTPAPGYQVEDILVFKTDDTGTTVAVTNNTFTMPDYSVTVKVTFAPIEHDHCVCGATHAMIGEHQQADEKAFLPVSTEAQLQAAAESDSSVYLVNDIEITNGIVTANGSTLNLCLNGKRLYKGGSQSIDLITVGQDGALNLTDCGATGEISGSSQNGIDVGRKAKLNLFGGNITGNSDSGIEAYLYTGIRMFGGKITNNSTGGQGGGIYMSSGNIYIYGGEISGNTAIQGGGIGGSASICLYGGKITGNTANDGGGIYTSGGVRAEGAPQVTGNHNTNGDKDNIYVINNHPCVQLDGPLTQGAAIGMKRWNGYGAAAAPSGFWNEEEGIDSYKQYLTSDDDLPMYMKGGSLYLGYTITKQPDTTDYSVEVNEETGVTYQWYRAEKEAVFVTKDDVDAIDPELYRGNFDSATNKWSAIGMDAFYGYLMVELAAGEQLEVEFDAPVSSDVVLMEWYSDYAIEGTKSGNTYTFTAPEDSYYTLWAYDAAAPVAIAANSETPAWPDVTAKKVSYTNEEALRDQTGAALITADLANGYYFCEASWSAQGQSDRSAVVEYHVCAYTYTASGNVISEKCTCGHEATATLTAPTGNLTYDGAEKKATVAYSDGWQGGALTVSYTPGNVNAGSVTASVTKENATASVQFEIEKLMHTVTYKAEGQVIGIVPVEHGKDATAPKIPAKEGYNETAPKWDQDGKNITADTVINAVYTKNQPGEYADVTPDTNVGGGKVAEEIEELKEKVPFTQEEEKQIEYGADVEVWLEIKDISDSVSSEDKAKVEEKLGDADVALYLDIAMFKQVGENEASRLTQLSDKVQITFKLDDSYINTDKDVTRTYSIIHVHDGKAEVITPVFDAATKTLTFETDRFSTYGVVYTDEKITPPAEIPATGDSFQPAFGIACMTLSIFGIAVLLLDAKRRHAR